MTTSAPSPADDLARRRAASRALHVDPAEVEAFASAILGIDAVWVRNHRHFIDIVPEVEAGGKRYEVRHLAPLPFISELCESRTWLLRRPCLRNGRRLRPGLEPINHL